MVQIVGKYQLEKNEKYYEYLKSLGMPDDIAKKGDSAKTCLEITCDGNKYTLKMDVGVITSISFVPNQEFDDPMPTGDVLKSVATVDGNKISIKSKSADGRTGERVYTFSDTGLVMTLTSSVASSPATRHYKRM